MPIDHCAEAERLRQLRLSRITTGGEKRVRFDNEEVEHHKISEADALALDRQIAFHERECALSQGQIPKRTRFARGFRFR